MSADLSAQLERYVAAVAADQEEISVAEVQPPLPVIGERSSPPSRDRRSVGRGVVVAVAAAVVLLVLVGSVALLTRPDDTGEPATPTTTSAPPETTPLTLIPAPQPESLNQSQIQAQATFLTAFRDRGFWMEGCGTRRGEPRECTVQIDSPTLGGPATRTVTLSGKPEAFKGDAVRSVAEESLAALYVWALETYPDGTAARCGVGFEGDDTAVAWSPGYAATPTCGDHLAGLLLEFNPAEAPVPPEKPDPGAGIWSQVETETPEGVPRLGGLFDVAETPVGLLATSFDGLWISQDAVEWRPYARDSVEFDAGAFSRIVASDAGIVVALTFPEDGGPWFSPDGVEWTLIKGLRLSPLGLTASNEGFLAIDEDSGVVSSTDGTTWRTVEDLPDADFHLVAATPLGFYAAQDTRIWRSSDGVKWTQLPATSLDGEVTSIAGTQTGLVAVTRAPTENLPDWSTFESRFWHTTDGTMWTEVQLRPQGNGEGARVSASESGFFALAGGPWFSEDGRLWAPVTTGRGEPGCCSQLTPFQDGFVGVTDWGGTARTQSGEWRTAVVWRYKR